MNESEFQAHAGQIQQLLERVNGLADEDARSTALELLQSLMNLHGAAFARLVEVLGGSEAFRNALAAVGSDPLLCGLLVLYGVHPVNLPERVRGAIENIQPQLRKQGGSAELEFASEAAVRVRVHSSGQGCGSTPQGLRERVEQAIREAAPEVPEVVVDGAASSPADFVPLNRIQPASKEASAYEKPTA